MPKTKGKGGKSVRVKRPGSAAPSDPGPRNFHPDAGPGCHIALTRHAKWLLGSDRFDPDEYDDDVEIPELAIDPETSTLSVININSTERVVSITVFL